MQIIVEGTTENGKRGLHTLKQISAIVKNASVSDKWENNVNHAAYALGRFMYGKGYKTLTIITYGLSGQKRDVLMRKR